MLDGIPALSLKLNLSVLKLLVKKLYDQGYTNLTGYMILVLPTLEDSKSPNIAGKTGITRQAIYHIIGKLEKMGYIEYRLSDKDYRKKLVKFTETGKALQQACIRAHNEIAVLIGNTNTPNLAADIASTINIIEAEYYKNKRIKPNAVTWIPKNQQVVSSNPRA